MTLEELIAANYHPDLPLENDDIILDLENLESE